MNLRALHPLVSGAIGVVLGLFGSYIFWGSPGATPAPAGYSNSGIAGQPNPDGASSSDSSSKPILSPLDEVAADFSPLRGRKLAESMTLAELKAALIKLEPKRRSSSGRSMMLEILRAWAKKDSSGAWQVVLAMPFSTDRGDFLGTILGALAMSQPDAALKSS